MDWLYKVLIQFQKNNPLFKLYSSLPREDFLGILKNSGALVGNSSSGFIESSYLGIPVVNIGTRQTGRLRQKSVIDVDYDKKAIKKAIKKAVFDKQFLSEIRRQKTFYGNGHASEKIIKILEKIDLKKIPIQKKLMY